MSKENTERNDKIVKLFFEGYNTSVIGSMFGISRERVSTVIKRFCKRANPQLHWKVYDLAKNHRAGFIALRRYKHRFLAQETPHDDPSTEPESDS